MPTDLKLSKKLSRALHMCMHSGTGPDCPAPDSHRARARKFDVMHGFAEKRISTFYLRT